MVKITSPQPAGQAPPSAATMLGFALLVILIGSNVVAVRQVSSELPPFWGAGTRFAIASALFLLYVLFRRIPLPRGRALLGVVIFGVLQFGVGFPLIYFALQELPAGLGSVILALTPLFTVLFAFAARVEPFRVSGLVGSLAAVAGIAVMFGESAGRQVPTLSLLAAVGTAAAFALAPVVVKAFPPVHAAATNGVGMLVGALILLALSLVTREGFAIPRAPATWAAYVYLVLPGSIGVFALFLYVLKRWTASAVSYQAVLTPIVTIALSAWLLDEPLTGGLFLGSLLVILGVYIGVLAPQRRRSLLARKELE